MKTLRSGTNFVENKLGLTQGSLERSIIEQKATGQAQTKETKEVKENETSSPEKLTGRGDKFQLKTNDEKGEKEGLLAGKLKDHGGREPGKELEAEGGKSEEVKTKAQIMENARINGANATQLAAINQSIPDGASLNPGQLKIAEKVVNSKLPQGQEFDLNNDGHKQTLTSTTPSKNSQYHSEGPQQDNTPAPKPAPKSVTPTVAVPQAVTQPTITQQKLKEPEVDSQKNEENKKVGSQPVIPQAEQKPSVGRGGNGNFDEAGQQAKEAIKIKAQQYEQEANKKNIKRQGMSFE